MAAIGIDIDSVLADTAAGITAAAYKRYKVWLPVEQMTCYMLEDCTELEDWQAKEIMNDPAFYSTLRPIPGAVQAVYELRKAGYDIWLVTARPIACTWTVTLEWLRSQRVLYHSLMFSERKPEIATKFGLSVFVEDRLETALALAYAGLDVYLIDWPWNQGDLPANVHRVPGWAEVLKDCLSKPTKPLT